MKKIWILLLAVLFLGGCVTTSPKKDDPMLEEKIVVEVPRSLAQVLNELRDKFGGPHEIEVNAYKTGTGTFIMEKSYYHGNGVVYVVKEINGEIFSIETIKHHGKRTIKKAPKKKVISRVNNNEKKLDKQGTTSEKRDIQ